MATSKQLQNRWADNAGLTAAVKAAFLRRNQATLYKDASELGPIDESVKAELLPLIRGLPFSEEVAPMLDLRGFAFEHLRNLDLSDVCLAGCLFRGHVGSCRMQNSVLDNVTASGLMQHDFTNASFRSAKLKRACMGASVLRGADFTKAKLLLAQLENADCVEAIFVEADFRHAELPHADLRGADLSRADFTESVLGGVRFDEGTTVTGAILTDAALSLDFQAFAQARGAVFGESSGPYPVSEFASLYLKISEQNASGIYDAVLGIMDGVRQEVIARKGELPWARVIQKQIDDEMMQTVYEFLAELQEARIEELD